MSETTGTPSADPNTIDPQALRKIADSLEGVDWPGGFVGQAIIDCAADYIDQLRATLAEMQESRDEYYAEVERTSEALGEGPYSSISEHAAALVAELAACRSLGPTDDEGYPLVECEACGETTLNDNTDECTNRACPSNDARREAIERLEELRLEAESEVALNDVAAFFAANNWPQEKP